MCVYIHTNFRVSSITLTSFRREVTLPNPPPPTANWTPKNPTQIKVNLKIIPNRYSPCFKHNLFEQKAVSWWPTSRINILTIYYKLGQGFITNWGSFVLLQIGASVITNSAPAWLLQNGADVITNWGSYYKLGQPLLQIGAAIINWGKLYYNLGQLLHIGAIITNWGIAHGYYGNIASKTCNLFRCHVKTVLWSWEFSASTVFYAKNNTFKLMKFKA